MISLGKGFNFKKKYKLNKKNTIWVIAILPNDEVIKVKRSWGNNNLVNREYHRGIIREEIMDKLIDRGYILPPKIESTGIAGIYPLMASLIRTYSIAFIHGSKLASQDYEIITSYIPSEITEKQYKIVNRYSKNSVDSVDYDDGNNFKIIDRPLKTYIKRRD